MAGSQLKQLKATLKSAGLTGQTNQKKKGKKHAQKTPNETRRADKEELLSKIREQFNPFDVKVTRNKRADAMEKKRTVGKPGISKQIGEENRRAAWEEKMSRKNKVGGLVDRRFGENNADLTAEEKMLERFARERQAQASKPSLFNLDDDDDDDGLTHLGQSLGLGMSSAGYDDDGDDDNEMDEDDFFSKKRGPQVDIEESSNEPVRKKTKAEVMKEVIAKSKFHKHERQKQQEATKAAVMELDDDFEDVMSTLRSTKQPRGSGITPKSEADIKYDMKVKEVALDRRAAPADRTKTEEELEKEKNDHLASLEAARLRRMEGVLDEDRVADADELDDDFWAGSDNEADGFKIRDSDNEDEANNESEAESESDSEDEDKDSPRNRAAGQVGTITIGGKVIKISSSKAASSIPCPQSLTELNSYVSGNDYRQQISLISKVFQVYQPRLAAGNKEKIGVFTSVLLDYILQLADTEFSKDEREKYIELMEFLSKSIRDLSEKFQEKFCSDFRAHIESIQKRIESGDSNTYPKKSDLLFYTVVGRTFSTSDLYHLVVTPTVILMTETLEFLKIEKNPTHLFAGIYISDLLLQYQRLSKRLIPEVINFLERAFLALIPEPEKVSYESLATREIPAKPCGSNLKPNTELPQELGVLKISEWNVTSESHRAHLLAKLVKTLDGYSSSVFKEKESFQEIALPFIAITKHLVKYHASTPAVPALLSKLQNLNKIARSERKPLRLQAHRAVAIPTYVPKFEENFNPDKKSYDPDATRQEIAKLRHQIKDERKQALREIRKDSQFEAREQIKKKKQDYQDYHSKMARILNSIQTEEGAAKNQYEKEKRQRKGR
ncbi:hypothetical protein CANARDRAFT_26759 [[Candida] arabinofermentans NRRL YB-2248]|uniref:Nop14-like protein n=1 Tax=[Candida] arabinofermentans NRRL YB-2248 TaxID=983967 RepID=A0A1E4T6H8_9ASCO|nr:hypothetical protein CANARDRAFT_26759 [[Candida] arabinofermentans NRRL YB-2248]